MIAASKGHNNVFKCLFNYNLDYSMTNDEGKNILIKLSFIALFIDLKINIYFIKVKLYYILLQGKEIMKL